jgi:shikimate kinase
MNIVLIGYRGTGKSVVGGMVGQELGMQCISMDREIVSRAGMSIPEIVSREGWPGFRDRETRIAEDLAGRDNIVIDCGGGVVERPRNIEALRPNARVFWLKASVAVIVKRIGQDTQRPALVEGRTFTDEVAEVLERRAPMYGSASDHEIDTDNRTPTEVADQVIFLAKKA